MYYVREGNEFLFMRNCFQCVPCSCGFVWKVHCRSCLNILPQYRLLQLTELFLVFPSSNQNIQTSEFLEFLIIALLSVRVKED